MIDLSVAAGRTAGYRRRPERRSPSAAATLLHLHLTDRAAGLGQLLEAMP